VNSDSRVSLVCPIGRQVLRAVSSVLIFATVAFGQPGTSAPSKDEILELMNKADEKVSGFEKAVKSVQPSLDKIDPNLSATYLNAASAARTIIRAIQKNGPSAYGLVSLVTTLDDLSLDAATASIQLMLLRDQSGQTGARGLDFLVPLMTAKNECYDISELIMHATLRYIHVQEDLLEELSRTK
jgi:hypothetical protein